MSRGGREPPKTRFNIFEHAIDDVRNEPRWKAARDTSINLSEKCQRKFMNACGGGYLPHQLGTVMIRENCDDLYAMYENMQSVLESHLYVSKPDGERIRPARRVGGARRRLVLAHHLCGRARPHSDAFGDSLRRASRPRTRSNSSTW